jgi:hypothetical protein
MVPRSPNPAAVFLLRVLTCAGMWGQRHVGLQDRRSRVAEMPREHHQAQDACEDPPETKSGGCALPNFDDWLG